MSTSTLALLAMVGATASWGTTFVLVKNVIDRMPVADFLTFRFGVAAIAMVMVTGRRAVRLPRRRIVQGLVLGGFYGGGQILQTIGLHTTPVAVSGFLTGLYVVLTAVLAGPVLGQRPGRVTWMAVGLATAGLAVMSLSGFAISAGELLILASTVLFAFHILGLGAWSTAADALPLAAWQMVGITIICGLTQAPHGFSLPPDGHAWAVVVFTALVSGAGALLVQTWAQAHLSATRIAVVMTMEPVWTAVFAVLLAGESLTARTALGGLMILAAMYLVELGPRHSADAAVLHPGNV
jgi:drug/metabolite transporter (DMT)-like permease